MEAGEDNIRTEGVMDAMVLDPMANDLGADFDSVIKEEKIHSPQRLRYRMRQVYRDVPIAGRRILEIGAGAGAFSLYTAASGAARVVAIEPEAAGSTSGVFGKLERALGRLGLKNLEASATTFQEFDAKDESFDVILSFNSINHLDEAACETIPTSAESRKTYVSMFKKMHGLLAPGGDLILADAMRWNLFGLLGIRNPMKPTTNWRIHQQPPTWMKLLHEAGFEQVSLHYRVPFELRRYEWLMDNRAASFVTLSSFTLHCRKR